MEAQKPAPSAFPELDLELNTVPDNNIVELSAAAEVATNVLINLEKLEALSAESLNDDAMKVLMAGINGQLGFTGLEPLTDIDMKAKNIKGGIVDRIEVLWTKVKLIIAKVIKASVNGLKNLFRNLDKMEDKFTEASKVLTTKKDNGKEAKISGLGIQALRFGDLMLVDPGMLKKSGDDIKDTMDYIGQIIKGSLDEKGSYRALRASALSAKSDEIGPYEAEKIKVGPNDEVFWGRSLPGHKRLLYISSSQDRQLWEFKRLSLVKTRDLEGRVKSATFKAGTVHKTATEYLDTGKDLIPLVRELDKSGRNLLNVLDALTEQLDAEGWRSIESVNQARQMTTSASTVIFNLSGHFYNILKATYVTSMRLAKHLDD